MGIVAMMHPDIQMTVDLVVTFFIIVVFAIIGSAVVEYVKQSQRAWEQRRRFRNVVNSKGKYK